MTPSEVENLATLSDSDIALMAIKTDIVYCALAVSVKLSIKVCKYFLILNFELFSFFCSRTFAVALWNFVHSAH